MASRNLYQSDEYFELSDKNGEKYYEASCGCVVCVYKDFTWRSILACWKHKEETEGTLETLDVKAQSMYPLEELSYKDVVVKRFARKVKA